MVASRARKSGVIPSTVTPFRRTILISMIKSVPVSKETVCYKCGKTGYLRKDCSLDTEPTEADKKAYRDVKINAITSENEEAIEQNNMDDSDFSSDSGKE